MSEPKTAWDALRREALHCPMLHRVVMLAEQGHDRERAMVAGLLALSRERREHINRETERLMHEPFSAFERGED